VAAEPLAAVLVVSASADTAVPMPMLATATINNAHRLFNFMTVTLK
jgi:hypothetical protein